MPDRKVEPFQASGEDGRTLGIDLQINPAVLEPARIIKSQGDLLLSISFPQSLEAVRLSPGVEIHYIRPG